MKELDLGKVFAEIKTQIDATDYDLATLVGTTLAAYIVMGVYITNDVSDVHTQEFKDLGLTIITTECRCLVIVNGKMTWIKSPMPICCYFNLKTDIESILMIIQGCFNLIDE